MTGRNKFGIAPPEELAPAPRRARSVGPMGAAIREAAGELQETTEAKIEQRRRNAEDAKAWAAARDEGRVLVRLPLAEIAVDDLPRDRLALAEVAASDEMEELKASIRAHGQNEPIEVYRDGSGACQLLKGWRRLTALRQLFEATGDPAFGTVLARIEPARLTPPRLGRYVAMVEENVVREDLTFAEMAQVAIAAAADPLVEESDPEALVGSLYASLHKMKRSYIRSFVTLLTILGEALRWPKAVSRNAGADLARILKADPERAAALKAELSGCATPQAQGTAIAAFLSAAARETRPPRQRPGKAARELCVGSMRVSVRGGECRIVSDRVFTDIPDERLERALRRFEESLGRIASAKGRREEGT